MMFLVFDYLHRIEDNRYGPAAAGPNAGQTL